MFFPRASASAAPASYRRETRPPRHLLGHGNQRHHPGHEETTAGKLGSQLAKVRKRIPRPGSKDGSRMPSCRGSSVARLLLAAGPRKIPGGRLGTLASASASFTCLDARCRQSVRPLQILLSRRLRRQVHQQPSPPHRFCPSRPNTLARGCPMGPARALLRRACCRRRTSAAATSQPPRPHRLHWACW